MKAWLAATLMAFVTAPAWAAAASLPGGLVNADLTGRTDLEDPARAAQTLSGGWLAFAMPVSPGTRSPCCWTGRWDSGSQTGCKLLSPRRNHGTRSDSPPTEHVIVYADLDQGSVQSLLVVGEACPVDAGGAAVAWLGLPDSEATLEWLMQVARDNRHDPGETALHAVAMHRSPIATAELRTLAAGTDEELSGQAVFWLGAARGADGFRALDGLLDELPPGERRREISFALSVNESDQAAERLVEISLNDPDPEQRGDALFWLAQEYPDRAVPALRERLVRETDPEALEQAVFAVSQLPGSRGTAMLLELAQNAAMPREVRRQALFWLAHSDDEQAVAALEELLTR